MLGKPIVVWHARRTGVSPSAACDVSFPLRVGFDGHPLYAAFRAVVTKDRAGGQVFTTGSALETRVILDRAPTVCPGTKVCVNTSIVKPSPHAGSVTQPVSAPMSRSRVPRLGMI
jgi:hypothetical protein